MKPQSYGTAHPGSLEQLLHDRTPQQAWVYRVEMAYFMATCSMLNPEQRAYLAHRYDEHVKIGVHPMITAAVKILINGIPDFEYVPKGH